MAHWFLQVVIALDQLVTALVGGYADETLSSYAWRMEQKGRIFGRIFRPLIDSIFYWQTDHCYRSYASEVLRRQLPPELRGDPRTLIPNDADRG